MASASSNSTTTSSCLVPGTYRLFEIEFLGGKCWNHHQKMFPDLSCLKILNCQQVRLLWHVALVQVYSIAIQD